MYGQKYATAISAIPEKRTRLVPDLRLAKLRFEFIYRRSSLFSPWLYVIADPNSYFRPKGLGMRHCVDRRVEAVFRGFQAGARG